MEGQEFWPRGESIATRSPLRRMPLLDFDFSQHALHFPQLRLWFDAHRKQGPGQLVFVSHAHSDHTARHAEVVLSAPTQKLMAARLGGKRQEHVLPFGERADLRDSRFGPRRDAHLTLWPAGHILGSAMAKIEADGKSLLYTGDFKLRAGLSAERCRPVAADVLVMETTFGRPRYVFPDAAKVIAEIVQFCQESRVQNQVPVLLGYSLGKAQELLMALGAADLPLMIHDSIARLTEIYAELGQPIPTVRAWQPTEALGQVVLAPPGAALDALKKHHSVRVAVVTGWAMDPGCRYRYRADAAFPLSDHADFPELIEFVRQVAPQTIYTLHGFAGEFATHLRRLGFDARALTEIDQFELALGGQPD